MNLRLLKGQGADRGLETGLPGEKAERKSRKETAGDGTRSLSSVAFWKKKGCWLVGDVGVIGQHSQWVRARGIQPGFIRRKKKTNFRPKEQRAVIKSVSIQTSFFFFFFLAAESL